MLAFLLLLFWAWLTLLQNTPTEPNQTTRIASAGYELGYAMGKRQRIEADAKSLPAEELNRLAAENAPLYGYNSAGAVDIFTKAFNQGYDAGLNPRFRWARLFQD